MKKRYSIEGWEKYSDKPAPIFKSKKEAEEVAAAMRFMRAWVKVVEVAE